MELWLPVFDRRGRTIEGYQVSDRGRIRSFWADAGPLAHVLDKPRIRKTVLTKSGKGRQGGYATICLRIRKGHSYTFPVHELVARAFLGMPGKGQVIIHRNYRRDDNRSTNLDWVSRSEAGLHAAALRPNRSQAKLTENDVRAIRTSLEIARVLAKKYKVGKRAIYDIRWGKTWTDVR